jgi:hypothetical protein
MDKKREKPTSATPSYQAAFGPGDQNLLLLDVASGFENRLQGGKKPVGRLDRVGKNFRGGQVILFRVTFLRGYHNPHSGGAEEEEATMHPPKRSLKISNNSSKMESVKTRFPSALSNGRTIRK